MDMRQYVSCKRQAGGDVPVIPKGVLHKRGALSVRPVGRLSGGAHQRDRSRSQGATVRGIAIVYVYMRGGGQIAPARRRTAANHQHRVADSSLRIESVGLARRVAFQFLSAEYALHELD